MVDYVAQLREGILDAYVGIVAGFKAADKRKFRLVNNSTYQTLKHLTV